MTGPKSDRPSAIEAQDVEKAIAPRPGRDQALAPPGAQRTPTPRPLAGGEPQDAGHFNDCGVTDNSPALYRFERVVQRLVLKWLNRRSQRRRFTWEASVAT